MKQSLNFYAQRHHVMVISILIKVGWAAVCGAVVGLERELNAKNAGLKTYIMISVGSALYTIASSLIPGDQTRIVAQIVSGMGFLGAGAILRTGGHNRQVLGLTTASMMWVMAAIGIIVGLGYGILGLVLSVGMAGTVVATNWVEKRMIKRRRRNRR